MKVRFEDTEIYYVATPNVWVLYTGDMSSSETYRQLMEYDGDLINKLKNINMVNNDEDLHALMFDMWESAMRHDENKETGEDNE